MQMICTALVQQGAEFIRDQASRLPLDLHSDADPARDKALADSVRAGIVDDVGIEEGRRIVNDKIVWLRDSHFWTQTWQSSKLM